MTGAGMALDARAIALIKARRTAPPAEDVARSRNGKVLLSAGQIARMTPADWRRAFEQTVTLTDQQITQARTRTDGTEIAAYLLAHGLDVVAHGIGLFNGAHADPRGELRVLIEDTLTTIWQGLNRAIQSGVEEYAGEVHTQMSAAADAAARDATDARRLLDAASAQLIREREQHQQEVKRLEGVLASERSATVNRERSARNELHQLRQDHAAQASVIAHLNAECERLETLLELATAPEVIMEPQNARERASLHVYLRHYPGSTVATWRAAYPTPEAMLTQLRAVILPLLGRAA